MTASVAVLLATYNGEQFLEEQLRSIATQTHDAIDVFVSDDGSSDATMQILEGWAARWSRGKFVVGTGPRTGEPVDNFRQLVADAPVGSHDLVAYADQDDIWLEGKLAGAVARLTPLTGPALHCSRTRLVDMNGRPIGYARHFRKPPAFRNALVQSLAGGNTMVMNRAAFQLVRTSMQRGPCVAHDWWTYQIVSGAGGTILYSAEADTLYRQHDDNAVGSNRGAVAALRRVNMVLRGRMKDWNDTNLATLLACRDLLTDDAGSALGHLCAARSGPMLARLSHLAASGVYRQTPRGQLSLWGACMLGLM